jgi:hypothetical protein
MLSLPSLQRVVEYTSTLIDIMVLNKRRILKTKKFCHPELVSASPKSNKTKIG